MQEDIENKTVSMAVSGSKFTGRMLKDAITKLLAHQKNPKAVKDVTPHGKQTVRQLAAQNQGMTSIEIKDKSIKDFERIARKYGVDFAVKKVKGDDPKFYVFFKAKDADALTAAFEEYTKKRVHDKSKPSVIKTLRSLQAMIAAKQIDPVKNKKQERSL